MLRTILCATALSATLAAAAMPARADDFLQQEGGMWRASKLAGVNIYGPEHKKVGDISDVLTGKDGKIAYVVIGVGGFLGIGQKDVAIPFDKVTFSQDPMPGATVSPEPAANTTATGAVPANTGMAPANTAMAPANTAMAPASTGMAPNTSVGLGTPATTNGAGTGMTPTPANNAMASGVPAAAPASSAYPDHGMIEYTADQLKSAPTFTYAK